MNGTKRIQLTKFLLSVEKKKKKKKEHKISLNIYQKHCSNIQTTDVTSEAKCACRSFYLSVHWKTWKTFFFFPQIMQFRFQK